MFLEISEWEKRCLKWNGRTGEKYKAIEQQSIIILFVYFYSDALRILFLYWKVKLSLSSLENVLRHHHQPSDKRIQPKTNSYFILLCLTTTNNKNNNNKNNKNLKGIFISSTPCVYTHSYAHLS